MSAERDSAAKEVELKFLLATEQDWCRLGALLAELAPCSTIHQHNLYLDTPDLHLDAARVMVRIRLTEQSVVATCKADSRLSDGLMTSGEWEAELPPTAAMRWRRGPPVAIRLADLPVAAAVLAAVGRTVWDPTLRVQASLQNSRQRFELARLHGDGPPLLPDGAIVSMELDRAQADAGQTRYELELEHQQAAQLRAPVGAFLRDNHIQWRPATEGKYAWLRRCSATAAGARER